MATTAIYQNIPITHQLALWLTEKSNESFIISNIQYHLAGRAALLGASLLLLAETVGRAIAGSLALLLSLGYWEPAKAFGAEQIDKASHAGSISLSCLTSIISPKELAHRLNIPQAVAPVPIRQAPEHVPLRRPVEPIPAEPRELLTPEARNHRVIQGAESIAQKLQRQFERAQNQAAQEADKEFQYLSSPANFAAEAHTERVLNYEVGVCHFIGRRPTMEDEHLATTFELNIGNRSYPIQLFGVFDGHGGNEASIFVRNNLEQVLHETLDEFCENGLTDEAIWNALKITCVRLTTAFDQEQPGTTATIAMILDGKLWTANVGDSRTILDNGIQLSEDAKPRDPYYRRGIENRGGIVFLNRVNGVLAVARAIGDHAVGAVNARPKIIALPLARIPQGTRLILTCDGIYDVASTRQIAAASRAHRELSAEQLAKDIVYSAYQAESGDNLSALVVAL